MLVVPLGINIKTNETAPNIVISNPYNKFLYFCGMFRKAFTSGAIFPKNGYISSSTFI